MRIAVVGCGAIAESFHLPALGSGAFGQVELTLVDRDRGRASALASRFGARQVFESHADLPGRVDAAIIATPHSTHVPIALDLVNAGLPVLSEKPLGVSVEEVESLRDASRAQGVTVAVNQTRRFIPACLEIARILRDGALGELRSVDVREGDRFGWPAATPTMFGRRAEGKGVLLDIGVHVFDLLTWWLGHLTVDSYRDDSFGGSEARAAAELTGESARVSIRLSWLAKQRNTYRFTGSRGTLEWGVYDLDVLTLRRPDAGKARRISLRGGPREFADLASLVIGDFLTAVSTGTAPVVTPEQAIPSMELIQACYETRVRFDMPWHAYRGPAVADVG